MEEQLVHFPVQAEVELHVANDPLMRRVDFACFGMSGKTSDKSASERRRCRSQISANTVR